MSVGPGFQEAHGDSTGPRTSFTGRFVAFDSDAANLVTGDTNNQRDVFVRDRMTGTVVRVSVDTAGGQADGFSDSPAISADGRYVAYVSAAADLVPGDTNAQWDIFVRDLQAGTTVRVSTATGGGQADGQCDNPSISADGRLVAFDSLAGSLVPGDTNGTWDVFVHDRSTGTTVRASVDASGVQGNANSRTPWLSADGNAVAFESTATNLVPGDTNGVMDVFVRDLLASTTDRVSVSSGGAEGDAASRSGWLSTDGTRAAFESAASNLVPFDTNGVTDVFVRDRVGQTTIRVSVATGGGEADGASGQATLSADGLCIVFSSFAANLVPADNNAAPDVFRHDLPAGTTVRASVSSLGVEAAGESFGYAVPDGRSVVFESTAANLVPGDTNGTSDVLLHGPLYTLEASAATAAAGDQLTFTTFAGDPAVQGLPALLYLTAIDGTWYPLRLYSGNLGPDGVWQVTGTVPSDPNLPGLQLTFAAFAFDPQSKVVVSNTPVVAFQ